MNITVQTGYANSKPDAVISGIYCIEYVLRGNDIQGHYNRFYDKPGYKPKPGMADQSLLVIFDPPDAKPQLPTLRSNVVPPANVAVLSFASSTFWTTKLTIFKALPVPGSTLGTYKWQGFTTLTVLVDFVARHVELNDATFSATLSPAQRFHNQKRDRDSAVWVQLRDSLGALIGQPFEVTPTRFHVDGLKKAIKAELGPKYPLLVAPDLTIFAPGTTAPAKPSSALCETTDDAPFLFQLPN